MKKNLFCLLAILSATFFTQCSTPYLIERGCIKDNFKIKFVDKDIVLNPDEFFSVKSMYLKINPPFPKDFSVVGYKRLDLFSYKIIIERLNDHKTYYGRLAFYNMINEPHYTNQAVATFYKIAIPETYFAEAKDGITACIYEFYYFDKTPKFPTWIIWFSDVPI